MDRGDLVACEDLVMFVNAAVSSTGQRESRSSAAQQRLSLGFLHEYVLGNYRPLYAAALALEVNHHNAALIVLNLLREPPSDAAERAAEGALIARRLRALPPQRVYALFRALAKHKVNNRRTRAIVRQWLAGRPDPVFDAVKYRRSLAVAARHAHLGLPGEVGAALFTRPGRFATPLLETWRRAHYDTRAVYELPYTVAEGFAARHKIPRERFLAGIEPRLTARERERLQGTGARLGVDSVGMDLSRMPLTRLAVYVLSLPRSVRRARRDELTAALRAAARRAAGASAGTWGRVVAVLDDSYSAAGSAHKRRRPLAVALATHFLLAELAADYTGRWLHHRGDPLLVHPIGSTCLGARLVDALERRPDRVVVVSDGWDNAPAGLAAEVLRAGRRLAPEVDVVHLNPVYDDEVFDVRALAPGTPSVGIRDAEDAAALVELARFATGAVPFAELRAHLDARVAAYLGQPC
ncbi:hypothetical protein ACOBQX_29630 [Actinokineospora sp. G85]|uniref:hypothetical protein n=1 Tax=Actinokineospora sp. G85 TaxID=3406626 RepID=UPI003C728686